MKRILQRGALLVVAGMVFLFYGCQTTSPPVHFEDKTGMVMVVVAEGGNPNGPLWLEAGATVASLLAGTIGDLDRLVLVTVRRHTENGGVDETFPFSNGVVERGDFALESGDVVYIDKRSGGDEVR